MINFHKITLDNGINVEIDILNQSAMVIKSNEASGNVVIPQSVFFESKKYLIDSIGEHAFDGNKKIKSLSFVPDSEIRYFGNFAFSESSLITLTIPSKFTKFEERWCENANSLVDINVVPKNPDFMFQDGLLLNKSQTILYFASRTIPKVKIPTTVKLIFPSAFYNSHINTIEFEKDSELETIDKSAFYGCDNLTHLSLPSSVTRINIEAFSWSHLEFFECEAKTLNIGNWCFNFCDSLKCVSFPKAANITIGADAFKKVADNFVLCVPEGAIVAGEGVQGISIEYIKPVSFDTISKTDFHTKIRRKSLPKEKTHMKIFNADKTKDKTDKKGAKTGKKDAKTDKKDAKTDNKETKTAKKDDMVTKKFHDETKRTFHNEKNKIRSQTSLSSAHKAASPQPKISYMTINSKDDGSNHKDLRPSEVSKSSKSEIAEYERKIHALQQENKQIIKEYSFEIAQLKNDKRKLTQSLRTQEESNKMITNYKKEILSLKEEVRIIKKENDKLNAQNKELTESFIKLNKKYELNKKDISFYNIEESKYHIIEEIERGATSTVFKVEKREMVTTVCAFKHLNSSQFKDQKNFIRECEIMYSVQHPCISKIIGFSHGGKTLPPTIILHYYPTDLAKSITQLTNTEKVQAIVDISLGLRYLHEVQDTMHRDLKPANILLSKHNHVRIGDFGLAKSVSVKESLTKGVGTLGFMAPELINEDEYTMKVDQYSFGILMYFILTNGKVPPFKMLDVLTGKMFPIPNTIPRFGRRMIEDCCSIDPKNRPTFSLILETLKSNNYSLLPNIDINSITNRINHIEFKEHLNDVLY
ncbi:hypothetical protein TRFO_03934 [Tritrichomonas foetus]|uniref:Protein kinase domain-containing protein n=1 Tax=Tritrichomonas foetus TaxID=1144522 RepID=A0A1J4KK63_9EUKA|nr:hypothetical protein TRFO_03934 [Tritrichomonas foetus]|eukprot:OHT11689.1 hypothetical protein TRFO_03934 [Tritrichomonas foetus]